MDLSRGLSLQHLCFQGAVQVQLVRDVFDAGELIPPACLDQHVQTEPTQMRHGMSQTSPMEPVADKRAFSGTVIPASGIYTGTTGQVFVSRGQNPGLPSATTILVGTTAGSSWRGFF